MSQKTWDSLTDQQRKWIGDAAEYIRPLTTQKALEFLVNGGEDAPGPEREVERPGRDEEHHTLAAPLPQDSLAKELGPYAVQLAHPESGTSK